MSFLDSTQLALDDAMSGSMLRQTLLTNDLANANTPNFSPQDVDFQQTLQQAMTSGQSLNSVNFTPFTSNQVAGPNGNGVDTDTTSTLIAENALLYQQLTQIAGAREGILKTAIQGS